MKISAIKNNNTTLAEALGQPYPYKWTENSDRKHVAEYGELMIAFMNRPSPFGKGASMWVIAFDVDGDEGVTGKGDAFKILSTVVAATKEWWSKQDSAKVSTIEFSATKGSGEGNGRTALYRRFATQFANDIGFVMRKVDGHTTTATTTYVLTNPKFQNSRMQSESILPESTTQNSVFGYKIMNYDPQTGQVISGADNRATKGMKLTKGMIMKMPAPGIFMSANRKYVETYYGGHNDNEVLIKFEFDPNSITTGNLTDVESEFTVRSATVVGFKIINNLEESTQINELFDKVYPWTWMMQGDNVKQATFDVDGDNVDVYFMAASHKSPNWETGFKKGSTIRRTGEGDQFRIFATVINIIETFMLENKEAQSLTFVAKREGAAAEDPKIRDSRAELYKRMIGRFAKKHDFEFVWNQVGRMTEFMLRRNVDPAVTESFEQPKSIKWMSPSIAQAVMPDSTILRIIFDEFAPKKYNIEFNRDDNMGITSQGHQMTIFATVLMAIKSFVDRNKPVVLAFTAERLTGEKREIIQEEIYIPR
jgi:hypothetical protein